MRELVHSVSTSKSLIAVAERETGHGGLTEAEARAQCLSSGDRFAGWGFSDSAPSPATLADALLGPAYERIASCSMAAHATEDGKPIVYERVGVFMQTMLRLVVQQLAPERKMYLPGELRTVRPLAPPVARFHVWCSRHNPGVQELIEEVRRCPWPPVAVAVAVRLDALIVCIRITDGAVDARTTDEIACRQRPKRDGPGGPRAALPQPCDMGRRCPA